jgi:hypothetical protein
MRLFEALFEALFALTGKVIEFAHIHQGRGFQAMIVDMCFKQAEGTVYLHCNNSMLKLLGWGMFLAKKFPNAKLSWQEHIQHTIIYCLVHHDRATRRSIGPVHKDLNKYLSLPHLRTKAEVESLIAMGKRDEDAKGI